MAEPNQPDLTKIKYVLSPWIGNKDPGLQVKLESKEKENKNTKEGNYKTISILLLRKNMDMQL